MFNYISPTELNQWADKIESRGLLPLLVRCLLVNRIELSNFTELDIPIEESICKPGLDGKVETKKDSILGKSGKYAIEFGQNKDAGKKCKEDFEKRTEQLNGEKSDRAFVFITCRLVKKKEKYAQELRSEIDREHLWSGVKVFDADDIATWLGSDPGTTIWLAEKMGKPTCGIKSVDRVWEEWLASTVFKLDENIIFAHKNKDTAVNKLRSWISSGEGYFQIKSAGRYESLLFFIACLKQETGEQEQKTTNEQRLRTVDEQGLKTIIVYDQKQWPFLVENNEYKKFILIPMFGVPENLQKCTEDGYKVFVPLSYNDAVDDKHTETISYIDKITLEPELYQKALNLSDWILRKINTSYISLHHLRRILAAGSIPPPQWLETARKRDELLLLLFAAFIGTWDENNEEDKRIISKVFGLSADEVGKRLFAYTQMDEAPIYKNLGIWKVSLPEEIIECLGNCLSKDRFDRYLKAARDVLVNYKSRWPTIGIARGFALISGNDGAFGEELCIKPAIGNVIREVFQKEGNWIKLNDCLFLFARAAPEVFLELLEDMLHTQLPIVLDVLEQTANFFRFTGVGIILALKSLSWYDSDFFRRTIDVLIKLTASIEPITNRSEQLSKVFDLALKTLANIFAPWSEDTTVSIDRRKRILHILIKEGKNISVVFYFLKKILETTHYISESNIPETASFKEVANNTVPELRTDEAKEYYRFIEKLTDDIKHAHPEIEALLVSRNQPGDCGLKISGLQPIVNKIFSNEEVGTKELADALENHEDKDVSDHCVVQIIKELRNRELDKNKLYEFEIKYISRFNPRNNGDTEFIMQSEIFRRFRENPQLFEEIVRSGTKESRSIAKIFQKYLEISPFETADQLKKWSSFVLDLLKNFRLHDIPLYERGCKILGKILYLVLLDSKITEIKYEVIEGCLEKTNRKIENGMIQEMSEESHNVGELTQKIENGMIQEMSEESRDVGKLTQKAEKIVEMIKNTRDQFPKTSSILQKTVSELDFRKLGLKKDSVSV